MRIVVDLLIAITLGLCVWLHGFMVGRSADQNFLDDWLLTSYESTLEYTRYTLPVRHSQLHAWVCPVDRFGRNIDERGE